MNRNLVTLGGFGSWMAVSMACGADDEAPAAQTESSTTQSESDETDTVSSADDTHAQPQPSVFPEGIGLDSIEVNQGVGFEVARESEALPVEEQGSFVRGRPMLVRAYWTLDDDWTPRSVQALLTLTYPDGLTQSLTTTQFVDATTPIGDPDATFEWTIPETSVRPGMECNVELRELDPDQPGGDSPVRIPSEGTSPLAVGEQELTLRLVFVPLINGAPSCDEPNSPQLGPEHLPLIHDSIYEVFPVTNVELTLHDPIEWDTELLEWEPLNLFLSELREQEGASPETIYLGIIGRPCGELPEGKQGEPLVLGDPGQPPLGVASAIGPVDTTWPFVFRRLSRSLGVLHGRGNISCAGVEAPDHEDLDAADEGILAAHGYSLLTTSKYEPGTRWDLNSMCEPNWITREGWTELYPAIQQTSIGSAP